MFHVDNTVKIPKDIIVLILTQLTDDPYALWVTHGTVVRWHGVGEEEMLPMETHLSTYTCGALEYAYLQHCYRGNWN